MKLNKKTIAQTIAQDGQILYCFDINGKTYIGQSTRGFWRLYQHFAASYYYSQSSGTFKSVKDLNSQKPLYAALRQVSWKDLNLSFLTQDYGLTDEVYTGFCSFFRPMLSNGLLKYIKPTGIPQLDIAELLYIYYYQSEYNKQCGSQHDIYEIAFQKGKIVPGKRCLKVLGESGTSVKEAADILSNPIGNSQKIKEDLENNFELNITDLQDKIVEIIKNNLINMYKGQGSYSGFKKDLEKQLDSFAAQEINIFKQNIAATHIFDTCSKPVQDWKIDIKPELNDEKCKQLFNLVKNIVEGKKINIPEGNYGVISIKMTLAPEIYKAIDAMDENLKKQWKGPFHFNGVQVDEDFRKKMALLRFLDIWDHVEERLQGIITPTEKVFHTRPARTKNSESKGMHDLPYYSFVLDPTGQTRKAEMYTEFINSSTYIPKDWDSYYHIMMSIADTSFKDLEFIRRVPLAKREKGVRREQYSIYIYNTLPSWLPARTDGSFWAYAIGSDETWIREWINQDIDLNDLTDY